MKIIKRLTIILLILFSITSCKTKIVCSQIESAKIAPLILYDISFQFNRCRARCFDLNKWVTLPLNQCAGMEGYNLSESANLPLESCEGVAGFSIDDMAKEIRPKIKKLDSIKIDYCN